MGAEVKKIYKNRYKIDFPLKPYFAPQLGKFCCLTGKIFFPNWAAKFLSLRSFGRMLM